MVCPKACSEKRETARIRAFAPIVEILLIVEVLIKF